jgi:hypothetical protein
MPMYTFHLRRIDEAPVALEIVDLPHDAATFAKAGELLDEHQSCNHVEVWAGERAVVARHRDQPIIRPVEEVTLGRSRVDRRSLPSSAAAFPG